MRRLRAPHLTSLQTGLALLVLVQATAATGYAVLGVGWSVWAGLAASLAIAVGLVAITRRRETASLDRLATVCRMFAADCGRRS